MKTFTFENKTYTCPFAGVVPPLSDDERAELKADIAMKGVLSGVFVTIDDEVIDGYHRMEIAAELGLTFVPVNVVPELSDDEKRCWAEDLNIHRLHLTPEQKREFIVRRLRANPSVPDSSIASSVGSDCETVAAERKKLKSLELVRLLRRTADELEKTMGRE